MKKYAIIVAGGKGNRFESDIPKQFVELAGKPILMYSLEIFYSYNSDIELIIVLPQNQIDFWKMLCEKHQFAIKHQIVAGGDARFYSVKNGLQLVMAEGLVAIHDGVRPLVDTKTIDRCFKKAELKGNAIPVIDLVDSIREIKANGSNLHVDRTNYKLIQTPQIFQTSLIQRAFEQDFSNLFTDDASVLESLNPGTIELVEGNRQNIKITTTEDLIYAEAILKNIKQ